MNAINGNGQSTSSELLATREMLESFSDDVKHLWSPRSVPVLERPPSSMSFLRDYVSKSTPCIIRNAMLSQSSECLSVTLDDLVERCQEELVMTVDVTPDGHGDCVRTVKDGETQKRMFVKPQEQEMTISEFRDRLRLGQQEKSRESSHSDTDESGKAVYPLETRQTADQNGNALEGASSTCNNDKVLYYSRQVS
jgi:hypothetical protein